MTRPTNCRCCGAGPMVNSGQPGVQHFGRGLCTACYKRAYRAQRLDDYPILRPATGDVLAAFDRLTAEGLSRRQIAEQLGTTVAALGCLVWRRRQVAVAPRLSPAEVARLRRAVGLPEVLASDGAS